MFSYEQIQSLNDLEFSVYNYIIKNREKVCYMKIRELAFESHVSTTTVLRFCKKVGCNGYSEFKIKFKMYLKDEKSIKPQIDTSILIDYFERVEIGVYKKDFYKAFNIIKYANYIFFIGIGNSGIIAKFGARYFSNIGKFSLFIDDPFIPIMNGDSKDSVIIALSVSGETKEVLNMTSSLKERGAKVISITNSSKCTLSKMSDCNISYYIPEIKFKDNLDITSQIPPIYIIEVLSKMLYQSL